MNTAQPSPSTAFMVEASGLTKVFRDFWLRPRVRAVNGIDLRIPAGRIFGILGPNGSGKSTTIKMIMGLLHPSGGTLNVLGRSPSDVRTKARIGYMPEESYLYRHLSARETLAFYGRLFPLSARERATRVEQLLEMVGLGAAANRPVGEFSKGMARRLAFAQALINDPELVILDEPTAGLDPVGCRQMKDLLLALVARGKTVVITSHLLADVDDVCSQLVILYAGRIAAAGTVSELLEVKDRHQLTIPSLPEEQLTRVCGWLAEQTGSQPDVSRPSRSLESFFLQIVTEAARSRQEPHQGALQDTQAAPFLTGGSEPGGADAGGSAADA